MITWEKTDYGFHLTFADPITADQSEAWIKRAKETVLQLGREFSVFVDLRDCELIPSECKPIVEDVQAFCRAHGLKRSVLILVDKITAMQFRIIAKKTGIYVWERYIDSSLNPDWEQLGMNWILHSIDPDEDVKQLDKVGRNTGSVSDKL